MPTPGGRGADLMIRALRVNNVRYFRGWSRMMGDPTMCRVSDDAMTMRMQFSPSWRVRARRNIRSATVTDRQRLVTVHVDVDICRHHVAYVVSSASDLSSCEPYLTKRQQQNEKTSTTRTTYKNVGDDDNRNDQASPGHGRERDAGTQLSSQSGVVTRKR